MFPIKPKDILAPPTEDETWSRVSAGRAALTEANRHADIIHISLVGMTAIVMVMLFAVALPVFGAEPVRQKWAFAVMVATAFAGIGGLYYMNYRVHQHVSNQARLTEVLVNSLGQGFLSFDASGNCGRVYSQACLDLIEGVPSGKNIIDVLKIPEDQRSDFKDWLEVLFMPNHALGFDDVVRFLPQMFPHSQGRHISLMYKPIRDKNDQLTHVVTIATDRTDEHDAQEQAQRQQSYAEMICRIFKERNQFLTTVTQIRKFIEQANASLRLSESSHILRALHTLKAAVKHFHLDELTETVQALETELRDKASISEVEYQKSLLVGQAKLKVQLNDVMKQVDEIVGQDYEGRGNTHEVGEVVLYDFVRFLHRKGADPAIIKEYLRTIAAVPIFDCFKSFERELMDLGEIMGKQMKPMRYTGSNPPILVRPMQDFLLSLSHICRNIIDHGIEPSVTRLSRGKDPQGQVSIHVDTALDDQQQKEWLHIIISEDGNGIDPAAIREKLSKIDPQGAWRTETDEDVIQHIFSWGFSTRENVTDMSGRGVGMEAVEREVKLLGGSIRVYSELGHGTKFDMKIPYSLELEDIGVISSESAETLQA
jgi:two-component system chemotaxis sensor kinase CheA